MKVLLAEDNDINREIVEELLRMHHMLVDSVENGPLAREDARTISIIALTANAFTSDVSKAHSAGMNDHLAKPIEIERLLEVLQKWMGQEA